MDDMTKDMIPRKAVEYYLRKETVSTNPEAYKAHKKFIGYMDDPEISQFGHWMHANGYNCALTSVAVDLDKIPSASPWWKRGRWLTSDDTYETGVCSVCKCDSQEPVSYAITMFKYCPSCGARMDREDGDYG